MAVRISGLASGIDTDAQVKALLKPQTSRVDKEKQAIQMLQWKRDSYRETNLKLSALKNAANDLKLPSVYQSKRAEASDTSVLTATSSADAKNGTHTITVNSLLTGVNRISTAELAVYKETLAEQFGISGTVSFKLTGKDGVVNTYSFDTATKDINSVVTAINANASTSGINVGYSAAGNRFVISTADEGADAKIVVADDTSGFLNTTLKLGLTNGTYAGTDASIDYDGATGITFKSNQFTLNDISFNLKKTGTTTVTVSNNTDAAVKKIAAFVDAYNALVENVNSKLHEKVERNSDRSIKYLPLTDEQKEEMTEDQIKQWETHAKNGIMSNENLLKSTLYSVRRTATDMISNKVNLISTEANLTSTSSINPYGKNLASQFGIYGTVKFTLTGMDGVARDYSFDSATKTMADVEAAINANTTASGIKATNSGTSFSLSTAEAGPKGKMTVTDTSSFLGNQLKMNVTNGVNLLSTAQMNPDKASLHDQFGVTGSVSFTLTGKDNVNTVYNFNETDSTAAVAAAINANTSTSGIRAEYIPGKGFSLSTVGTGSAATIKVVDTNLFLKNCLKINVTDNVLYKGNQTSNLTNTFQGTQTPTLTDPLEDANYIKYKSLESIGITTGKYLEDSDSNGMLSINSDKLIAALESNPEDVMKLFNATQSVLVTTETGTKTVTYNVGVAVTMFDQATKSIADLTSKAGLATSANDNSSLTQEIYNKETLISKLNTRIKTLENYWYRRFTAMEQAIQKANQQSSWLSQKMDSSSSS